jgi:hypothetical protein
VLLRVSDLLHRYADRGFAATASEARGVEHERFDTAVEEIGPTVGATLDRPSDFNEEYGLDLMSHLQDHPDLKDEGVPETLTRMEYWDAVRSMVEEQTTEHPEGAQSLMEDYLAFMGEWAPW